MNFPDSPFLTAANGKPASHTPVWFMRQAGRSLPEYRKLRKSGSIIDTLTTPELAAEITLQPVERYGVDAAILYSDIMVPLIGMGAGVEMVSGRGPVIEQPYREEKDLSRLRTLEPETDTKFVLETIEILIKELEVPLIGFAGAPFTLASYLIEGGSSKNYELTKAALHENTAHANTADNFFQSLLSRLTDITIASLTSQIIAGVSAVQLFDSWVGVLSPSEYEKFVLPHTKRIFEALSSFDVPLIHFGVRTGELLSLMGDSGATVLGVDYNVALNVARKKAPNVRALQGNLDPTICLEPWEQVEPAVRKVLAENENHPGYIFNLGHGVLPETDPDILASIVELVHNEK